MIPQTLQRLKELRPDELDTFLAGHLRSLLEDEALAILGNPLVTPSIIGKIAHNPRLTGFYSVRLRLVAHRQTPQAHALKFVHYLYWVDLVRLSVEMTVPTPVRRAIDNQLVAKAIELTPGERIASARRCSHALIKALLFDPDPRVFEALLINSRLHEDDLVYYANSRQAGEAQLGLLAGDPKWSYRYAIRMALVLNPSTPRAAAAAQLRYLRKQDLRSIYLSPKTSVYIRRCIERLREHETGARPHVDVRVRGRALTAGEIRPRKALPE